jgi:hypothetical protein
MHSKVDASVNTQLDEFVRSLNRQISYLFPIVPWELYQIVHG